MSDPIFVNKDAEYLYTLGQTFIEDGDLEGGLRLSQIAQRLQSLDDRALSLDKEGLFAAGVQEGMTRIYGRTNFPGESMPAAMRKVFAGKPLPAIKKIPTGMTAQGLREKAEREARESAKKPDFSGIKLDLKIDLASLRAQIAEKKK